MKYFLYSLLVILVLSCNSEAISDCLKTAGSKTQLSYNLGAFSKVIFHEDIVLEIRQGATNTIHIEYGENLIDNITTTITNDQLIISNTTGCSLARDIKPATVILTATNLSEIRNASQYQVFNTTPIYFDSLTLISEDYLITNVNVGDFDLNIENQAINVITNNVSNFTMRGTTTNLAVNFASGQGKFEGEHLIAQNIYVFHRGINHLVIHPTARLTGEIRSSGNIISVNRPPLVTVEAFYTGKLIFRN
tara:strand:+ start:421185 stop:421931 length:747 start_codon:yes stop_codon:yes gene_type:complete